MSKQLPKDDFVLLAESFSGPIANLIAANGLVNLKSIILVATFLSPPKRFSLPLLPKLPFQVMLNFPLSSVAIKLFCLGREVSDKQIMWFKEVVLAVPKTLIRDRIQAARSFECGSFESAIPTIYIQASDDCLVPASAYYKIKVHFKNVKLEKVEGPHFLLQTRTEECARLIRDQLDRHRIV